MSFFSYLHAARRRTYLQRVVAALSVALNRGELQILRRASRSSDTTTSSRRSTITYEFSVAGRAEQAIVAGFFFTPDIGEEIESGTVLVAGEGHVNHRETRLLILQSLARSCDQALRGEDADRLVVAKVFVANTDLPNQCSMGDYHMWTPRKPAPYAAT